MAGRTSNQAAKAAEADKVAKSQNDKEQAAQAAEPSEQQFPSLSGAKKTEIAERAADVVKKKSPTFDLKLRILKRDWKVQDRPEEIHERNYNHVRQQAINQGLRPTGDAVFTGEEDVRGDSLLLCYSLPVEPAATAADNHAVVPQDRADG